MSDIPVGLTQVADKVDARLEQLFADERAQWVQVDPRLVEAIDELARMTAGGKRLRAGFCYWAWAGVHDGEIDEQPIIDAGAAFELLQVFALIHDDVMDAADTRRNRPTIHVEQAKRLTSNQWRGEPRRYGEGVAILVGDLGHVYADRFVGGAHPTARNVWDQLRIELNLGQYLDMQAAASGEVSRETAQRVAMFKSALYTIVRPLQLGAALHGRASPALLDQLDAFGRPIGQAFQLRDDLLGVFGDADRVGKPVGGDLRDGKPTELVAVAAERASDSQRKVLATIGRPDLSDQDISALLSVLDETGAVREIERRIDSLVEDAIHESNRLPFAPEVRKTLVAFATYVAARNH
ncbi:MAG: polyprenyl synthetase family protein [Acidimicrobiales bacterium]